MAGFTKKFVKRELIITLKSHNNNFRSVVFTLGLVFPALKKPNLDPNVCLNCRPIYNLSYLSKTLERLVSAQLVPYLEQSGLLPPTQSGFRGHHSTETVLLSLLSDIYTAIDRSQLSLLALFDVSAAFDMVDHEFLLQRLYQ